MLFEWRNDAEEWVRRYVDPVGPIETVHVEPWATVMRIPTADGPVWFKTCGEVQAFEPRLSARLFERWPDLVPGSSGTTRASPGLARLHPDTPMTAQPTPTETVGAVA